ncbi:TPA: imidazole glycerol phosphate synthase subunit HisH [bacterium]|nr:imidazole glycerol phosphate synthase subunit HisH [bacterium]
MNICIINYGMGNLHSVKRKIIALGVDVSVTDIPSEILKADKLILPGVGHFAQAMNNICNKELKNVFNEMVLMQKKPVLGICLGMQLMAEYSEEGNCRGLGWINANVIRFKTEGQMKNKVPHMGWNTVCPNSNSVLLKGINDEDEFYFAHSYHIVAEGKNIIAAETDYIYRFCSVFENDNLYGVQFHPEKSHDSGLKILKNFIKL